MNQKQIMENDKENLSIEILELKEFMDLVSNAKISDDFKTSVMNITNSQIQEKEFYFDEISKDLKNVRITIDKIDIDTLTPSQEDYIIESGIERIRGERENGM